MSQAVVIGSVILYAAVMFTIAWRADRTVQAPPGERSAKWPAGLIFGLSLAVYCTSWTFYGAVGTARTSGIEYLPIYLGPFLIFSAGHNVIRRIVTTGKRIHSTSIADFMSAHYQKSRSVAALVSLIAVIGALPYIALQLKSVATSFSYITGLPGDGSVGLGGIGLVAVTLAVFAVMFGTRHIDITRHNRGMIAAIAFDSVFKLVALIAVGMFAFLVADGPDAAGSGFLADKEPVHWDRFITLTLLSMAAVLCLPRQFHVTVVECRDKGHLTIGSLTFCVYLFLISIVVIPIVNSAARIPAVYNAPPDLTVLALPLAFGSDLLALLAFVGGFAAATGMVIVASVALSTMITNDLVAPFFLRKKVASAKSDALWRRLLIIRRCSIVVLLAGASLFAVYAPKGEQLSSFGILSFAAVAQYIPALLGALYWKGVKPAAALAAMATGFFLWGLLLLMPSYFGEGEGLSFFVLGLLDDTGWDSLSRGVFVSLAANSLVFLAVAVALNRFAGTGQAVVAPSAKRSFNDERVRAGDLYILIRQCLGDQEANRNIALFEELHGRRPDPDRIAGPKLIAFVDEQISKAIGASSASILLKSVLAGGALQLDDVATLLGETSGRVQFSQDLLQTTLENISTCVSVVDSELRLVAWNAAYAQMYRYPPDLLREGSPIAGLIRYNAERGECGPGDVEDHVKRRLTHLKAGKRHAFERTRPDGRVVKIEGVQSPSGAYVTTFTDVTDYKRIEKALIDSERSIRFYTDNIPAMASFADANEVLRFANSAYRTVFQVSESDIDRKKLSDILTAEDYHQRKSHIDRALSGHRSTFDIELNHSGQRQAMQVTYVPEFDPDGLVRGFFGIYQDVTARREAEEALARTNETLEDRVHARTRELINVNAALETARREAEEATASKTRFLAAASHDVLQPLNAARLFTSALIESDRADPEIADLSLKIDASIASADRLLRSLLDISKLDAGGIRPDISAFPLDALFAQIRNDFTIAANEKSVQLEVLQTGAWVRSDRGLLLSALQNIVANAVRYTDEGRILVGVRRAGLNLRIEVYDTGRGIPDHRRREIFREFRRLDRDKDIAGAGLGLAMVDRICRLLSIDLNLRSENGRGSVFAMTVPRASAKTPNSQSTPRIIQDMMTGLDVLCIDNDKMVLAGMESVLRRWGADVRTFQSDRQALDGGPGAVAIPDLLILDNQLDQGRTGFDALKALEDHWKCRPATIMITASLSGSAQEQAAQMGIPVLSKPVEPAELRALISRLRVRAAE